MKVISGKRAPLGGGYRIHQFANDWVTADGPDGRQNIVLRPTMVQVEGDEYWRMRESYSRYLSGDRKTGQFWDLWELREDGTFTRRRDREHAERQRKP